MIYCKSDRVTIHAGDCFEELKGIPDNSIDAFVADGPYGIRFMGKAWDGADIERQFLSDNRRSPDAKKSGMAQAAGKYNLSTSANRMFQEWTEQWSREALRVLKPGGHMVNFTSPRTYHRMVSGVEDAGFEIRDQLLWVFGSGFPKSHNLEDEGDGWGTALKPSFEPIVLARKPIEDGLTIKENFAKWGTGCLHVDACLISVENKKEGGRWPANMCHDGSDEVLAIFPDDCGAFAKVKGTEPSAKHGSQIYGQINRTYANAFHADTGSASRFYYCGKASRADREAGLEHFKLRALAYGNQAQAEVKRGNLEYAGKSGINTVKLRANIHPTVKPTELMRWLVRLVCPKGGTVLDCFAGSGTTGRAALLEGMNFIGMEKEEVYLPILRARLIEAVGELFSETL